jgi:hypothetical protein
MARLAKTAPENLFFAVIWRCTIDLNRTFSNAAVQLGKSPLAMGGGAVSFSRRKKEVLYSIAVRRRPPPLTRGGTRA